MTEPEEAAGKMCCLFSFKSDSFLCALTDLNSAGLQVIYFHKPLNDATRQTDLGAASVQV